MYSTLYATYIIYRLMDRCNLQEETAHVVAD